MCGPKNLPCSKCLKCLAMSAPSKSLHEMSTINRAVAENGATAGEECSLELEVDAAIFETSIAFKSMWVSQVLPNTPELLYVNVTSVERQTYCFELTFKGWRLHSLKEDCVEDEDISLPESYTATNHTNFIHLMNLLSPEFERRRSIYLSRLTKG